MPRKGWSTVQVPDGWLQLIRGPCPQAVKWPTKGPNQKKSHGQGPSPVKSRRTSQVAQPPPAEGQRGHTPEEVISNARARVTKLEVAMAAVGETDPTFGALQEALKKAQSQAQARPVADRIASTKVFIERAKKRVTVCREEVSRAQELFAQAQTKLQSEEQGLVRHVCGLFFRRVRRAEEPLPTAPASFAHELAELQRTTICDPSCSPPEDQASTSDSANSPKTCQVLLSISGGSDTGS